MQWSLSICTILVMNYPVDNFGTVVGENPDSLWNFSIVGCQWTVNCLLGSRILKNNSPISR